MRSVSQFLRWALLLPPLSLILLVTLFILLTFLATEETRRSGRANKGQHTKNLEALEEPAPVPAKAKPPQKPEKKAQPKGQPKGNAVRAQSTQSAEAEEEDEEEEEEEDAIIRCVCGDQRDIRGRQMICCDMCEAWQHNKCLGLPEGDYWDNKSYFCERCKPEQHEELLAAMARGEKPWARKKGSKPKPRASDVKQEAAPQVTTPRASETPSQPPQPSAPQEPPTPTPAQVAVPQQAQDAANGHDAGAKVRGFHPSRGQQSTKLVQQDIKSQPQSPVGEKRRHEPTPDKASASKKRRKSSHHENKAVATPGGPLDSIEALPSNQKALAEKLVETLNPLIKKASDERNYRIPDGDTPKSLATRITLQISDAAFKEFGEPTGQESEYFLKFRTIMFNVRKNSVLVDRLLSGNLKAPDFVTMEAEEMASADKQREYAAMREAAEKQMTLTEEPGPRLRKTHKGEEIVGEDNVDNQDFKPPPLRERESATEDSVMQSPISIRPPESPAGPPPIDTSNSQPDSARRASANFDINSVFDKVRTPQHDQQTFIRRQSTMQANEKPSAPVDDADVDRLLKDDNDVEMSGFSTDPTVCWQGSIQMQSMEPFDAVARFVAGGDFGQIVPWEKLLTNALSVQGRIESAKGNDYIQGIAQTESHEVSILSISPVTTEGRVVQDHLYTYFHSRGRWGVVPVENLPDSILRDLYVIPIEAGGSNLPPFIDMLEYCTIETPRKEAMLILALIAKIPEAKPTVSAALPTDNQPTQQNTPTPMAPYPPHNGPANGPSPSPVSNPHGPQYSPVGGGFPPQVSYGNPYAPQPPAQMIPQQPPVPFPHPNAPPHHHIPRALEILGPYIDAPVIVTILSSNLSQNAAISEIQMTNLRHIVESIPEARDNIQVLTEHLKQKSGPVAQTNGQGLS